MNKDELIQAFMSLKSNYVLSLAALRLFNQEEVRPFVDSFLETVEDPYNRLFTTEEIKKHSENEFFKMALRATIKESFEIIKNYCEITGQKEKFKSQPWHSFTYLLHNPLSHNFIFKFNKYEKSILPVTWNGRTITAEMDGTPLRVELMNDQGIYDLLHEMEKFIYSDSLK